MILVIDALNRTRFAAVVDDMLALRARVFAGRLGWEVTVAEGRERDAFDDLDPAYVVGLDGEGRVVACARLLQTTGPHMLADVFAAILDGEAPPRSPTLWESTRFCVDTARLGRGAGEGGVARATCELMVGTLEYARESGVTDIVTVIDPIMDRVLRRSGNAPHGYLGRTAPMGIVPAMAALLDCTAERIARVRAAGGLTGPVRMPDDVAAALLARAGRMGPEPAEAVRRDAGEAGCVYAACVARIRAARTAAEREAAFGLMRDLLEGAAALRLA